MIKLRIMIKYRVRSSLIYLCWFLLPSYEAQNSKKTIQEDGWFDKVFINPEEAQAFVEQKHFSYHLGITWIDWITFGFWRALKNLVTKFTTNYTGLIASNEELDKYALIQKQRLFLYLQRVNENIKKKNNSKDGLKALDLGAKENPIDNAKINYLYEAYADIIREIAIDFSVFGGSNKKIEENFYILRDYLNNMLMQQLMDVLLKDKYDERSTSFRIRYYALLYSLNFKFNSYLGKFILNIFMPHEFDFLVTPSNAKNIIYRFSAGNLLQLIRTYQEAIDTIKTLDATQEESSLETELKERINDLDDEIKKIESTFKPGEDGKPIRPQKMPKMPEDIQKIINSMPGMLDQFDTAGKLEKLEKTKENLEKQLTNKQKVAEENKRRLDLIKEIFMRGPTMGIYDTPGLSWFATIFEKLTKVLGFPFRNDEKYPDTSFENFKKKHFDDIVAIENTENSEIVHKDVELIEQIIKNQDMSRIYKRRNQIFFDRAQEDYLQQKDIYILSILMPFIRRYLTNKLEDKVSSISSGFFFELNEMASKNIRVNYIYAFPEDMLIDRENNEQLMQFLKQLVHTIKKKQPIPHVIFLIHGENQERHVKNIMTEICKREHIVFYIKKIFNPVFITNFYVKLTGETEGKKKKLDMSKLTSSIFKQNIASFKNLLQSYFIGEQYNYLPWFSKVLHESMQYLYRMEKYTLNIGHILKQVVTVLEISGFEFLCRDRNTHSAYSLASLVYIDLINHFAKDVTIFAYTERMDQIDRAVLSRIPFQISFTKVADRVSYLIIVRRLLLDMMKSKKINFDGRDFEEGLFNLVGAIYMEDYEVEEVQMIFIKLSKSKEKELPMTDIINLFKKKVKEEERE